MSKFNVGQSYQTRSICDSECIYTLTVAKRTAKTLTDADGRRYGIKVTDRGVEFVSMGRYSMASQFHADDKVIDPARIPAAKLAPVSAADEIAAKAAAWSAIAGEAVTVVRPGRAFETRDASEEVCRKLAAAFPNEPARAVYTEVLGWRFVFWPAV